MPLNVPPDTAEGAPGRTAQAPPPAPAIAELPLLGRLRFFLFGRTLPAFFFGFVAWNQIHTLRHHIDVYRASPSWTTGIDIPHDVLYLLFCAIPVGIYLTRAVPRASDGSLPARVAAFAGTTILLFIGAFVSDTHLFWSSETLRLWVGSPILVAAFAFAVVGLLYLRRNLSIMPEARGLVTAGPYSLVRHPLYLAEIAAALGFIVGSATGVQLVSFVIFVALQMARAGYEERLLSATFPEYAGYAARTKRILPGVW